MQPALQYSMNGPSLRLLGGFTLADAGGRMLVPPGCKARMLLTYVALNATQPVSRDRLAGLLWDDCDDRRARHRLRQCLMELRRLGEQAGGDLIRADNDTVALALPVERVDGVAVERFARENTPDALRAAAGLCAGALLPEAETGTEGFDTWLSGERARFARISAGVFARLTALCEAQGDWDGVASTAERWLTLDPACEEAHRAMMRVHISAGRRSDAVLQYKACAEAVRRHIDGEPEEETVELLRGIRNRAHAAPQTSPQPAPQQPGRPSLACCPSAISMGWPREEGSPTDSPTTSCHVCRACARCSSSPTARPSAFEASRSTRAPSDARLACAISLPARSAPITGGCA
jgi:DNA-binding SARP family transcriptional activator